MINVPSGVTATIQVPDTAGRRDTATVVRPESHTLPNGRTVPGYRVQYDGIQFTIPAWDVVNYHGRPV